MNDCRNLYRTVQKITPIPKIRYLKSSCYLSMVDIELDNLSKVFDTPSGTETAVDNIDLKIRHGEFHTFVGPSGCGKTTTLRMIAGLETPTNGRIYFDGENVTDLTPQNRDISMVFQNTSLFPHMTARENIGYSLKVRKETEDYEEKIHEVSKILEISDLLDKKPNQLSGGQQQRVALGRAIIRDPNVILMDEPMSDLDAKLKATIRVEIQRIREAVDSTFIYVTHDQSEAMTMSTKISLMQNGQIEQTARPNDIFQKPTSEFAGRFIGQPEMNFLNARLSNNKLSINNNMDIILEEEVSKAILKGKDVSVIDLKIGFRPGDSLLTNNPSEGILSLELDVIEPIGNEHVIHLTDGEGTLIDVVTDDVEVVNDGNAWLKNSDRWYIFDSETGEKLYQTDELFVRHEKSTSNR